MTALEARTLATNLMRALLAVPGAKRSIDLNGEEGIAFVEALGVRRSVTIYAAKHHHPAPYVLTVAVCYASQEFQFYAQMTRPATADECARLIEAGLPSTSVISGGESFHPDLGADLA